MRRWAFLLSILAACAGAPLRQAEAAADLGRSLAGLVQPADVDSLDGGVGDDSGDATPAASHGPSLDVPAAVGAFLLPPPASSVPSPAAEEALWERAWWPPSPPGAWHAWLDVFRF